MFMVACIALFLCSCQKEDLNSSLSSNLSSASNNITSSPQNSRSRPKTKSVAYGALIEAPSKQESLDFQVNVASQLGISCLRSRVIVPASLNITILNSGYKVLLNFNSDFEGTPIPFVLNLTKYQADLKNTLAGFAVMPAVAVIENEEANVLYHSGNAQEYINQLNAAIEVMHTYGIKVANGGITDRGLNYLVYQDFIRQGKYDSAEQFRKLTHLVPQNPMTQDRGAYVNTLLQAYARMDLDYVNFHWKGTSPDILALTEVIAYLKKVTHKPIISNELGQFDKDPNTLTTLIQACTDAGFPYIVWYSPDENAGRRDTPLQHGDASLTPSGAAYQHYLNN